MRVLCTCVPGYGHLHPMVPIGRALQDAGHEVAFATEERFCGRVDRAGFSAFPAGIGPGKVLERTLALPDVAGPGPEDAWRFGAQMFAAVAAPAKVADLVGVIDEWSPDLVVHDVTDFAGPVAAAHAGIPWAAHSLGPMFPLEFSRLGGELVAPLWRTWGLTPDPFGGMFASAYLDICPPSLQLADIDQVPLVARRLRPVPFDAVAGEILPPWVDRLAPQPTAYVTLGTLDNDAPGVIEAAVAGLRDESLNVIVTVGPDRAPEELGSLPPNVHVERYLPQSLLLPRCDVVVAHGGSGTTLAALALGLPLLLVPQGANQFWNAERCAELGVGIRLLPGEVRPESVREGVRALLGQPAYRRRARELAGEISRMPAPADVVGLLEALGDAGRSRGTDGVAHRRSFPPDSPPPGDGQQGPEREVPVNDALSGPGGPLGNVVATIAAPVAPGEATSGAGSAQDALPDPRPEAASPGPAAASATPLQPAPAEAVSARTAPVAAPDAGGADIIVTTGLTKTYPGGATAVDRLDLSVREGEIFALLGPNGAGKTTTVGMLTARVVPSAGKVLVNGVDVVADPARAKASVGVVPQANTLDRSLSVWENLYFHGRYFGYNDRAATSTADRLLEKFRLTGRAKAAVTTLSGGMARRLMLARAFLPRPAVIFLDEPTAGLDPQSRLALWEIVGELHAEGETILLTTHYMEEAERLAQRVAIMDRGRLLALDTPERLRRSLGTGPVLVIEAEGDLARLAGELRAVPGVLEVTPAQGRLRVRLEEAEGTVAAVVTVADGEGFSLRSLSVEETSLETVFIDLTGKELRE